jgi:hypothetical protein
LKTGKLLDEDEFGGLPDACSMRDAAAVLVFL